MNWYLAKIVYQIVVGEGNHTPQFDEQLRLISGNDENEAFDKAIVIGRTDEDSFFNQDHQMVKWTFIDVAELYKLSGLLDGAEMYSRIQETDDPNGYIELTHRKAENIRRSNTHQLLQLL